MGNDVPPSVFQKIRSVYMHLSLGSGEALLAGMNLPALGYECFKHVAGERAMHVFLRKRG